MQNAVYDGELFSTKKEKNASLFKKDENGKCCDVDMRWMLMILHGHGNGGNDANNRDVDTAALEVVSG